MSQTARQFPEVVDDVTVELSLRKTPLELTTMTSRMFSAARDRLKGYLQQQHPEWSEKQVREELIWRIYGVRSKDGK